MFFCLYLLPSFLRRYLLYFFLMEMIGIFLVLSDFRGLCGGVFNPSKVFPEILEPLGGYIAAFMVYPLTGDYVASIAHTQSIIISAFIFVFFWISYKYFKERFSLSSSFALCIEVLFFLSFFLIFKQKNVNSYYGFWATDLNCYFNYIIPGVFNASVMLLIAKSDNFWTNDCSCTKKLQLGFGWGFCIICIYLALFSNIQSSIILSGYCSIKLVEVFVRSLKENNKWYNNKEIWVYVVIDLLWLISLLFESSGRRAMGLTKNATSFFIMPVSETFAQYRVLLSYVGKYYSTLFLVLGMISAFILLMDKNIRKKFLAPLTRFVLLFAIVILYLSLIHAKSGGSYGRRPDAMWPAVFLVVMISSIFFAIVFSKLASVEFCLIPMIFISFFVAFNLNGKFIQFGQDYDTAKKINDYIIEQILVADKTGLPKAEVKVPQGNAHTNWPYPFNMANWLQNALYSHNVISNRVRIKFVPDPALNKKFYKKNIEIVPFTDLEHD